MATADDTKRMSEDMVHLARIALAGRPQDVHLFLRRAARNYREGQPALAEALVALLRQAPTRSSPLRKGTVAAIPVDVDSRLQLVRHEVVGLLPVEPIFDDALSSGLSQLVNERRQRQRLEEDGLLPTRTALFVGEPGVGKSLAAKWVARELGLPLLTLDLSAVMSSFLGRTGNNVRHVLDYAKGTDCVLFIDELDAVAKKRDDATEVGELKRLVTVLLQEIDDWPPDGLLLAATNHSSLLDPAVWRRFDVVVRFPMPSDPAVRQAVQHFLGEIAKERPAWAELLTLVLRGRSFSDIEREIMRLRRALRLSDTSAEATLHGILGPSMDALPRSDRVEVAVMLARSGLATQRQAHELTGVSRDTIRGHMKGD